MLSMVKMLIKGEVEGHVFRNSHGNYIVDHGKIMELFLNFCGNPVINKDIALLNRPEIRSWYIKYLSRNMRFPTMWYVPPAKAQPSLRIRAVWSEPFASHLL